MKMESNGFVVIDERDQLFQLATTVRQEIQQLKNDVDTLKEHIKITKHTAAIQLKFWKVMGTFVLVAFPLACTSALHYAVNVLPVDENIDSVFKVTITILCMLSLCIGLPVYLDSFKEIADYIPFVSDDDDDDKAPSDDEEEDDDESDEDYDPRRDASETDDSEDNEDDEDSEDSADGAGDD
ncbi:uncharacterized protein [Ptychodera flava]|uniref:uncharacterized protein n=1 Tax=Ptychodera flava TaxID=63121 RepID=UPI003969EA09